MPEIQHQLRKLRVLSERCGVGEDQEQARAKAVDMEKMTAYEQQQYKIAATMNDVRQNISELDNLPQGTTAARRSELSNAVRKGISTMKKETADAKRHAQKEDRKSDYEKLVSHLKKTEQLYRSRFAASDDGVGALLNGPSGGNERGATELDAELSQLASPTGGNLHDDEEFQMFFEQTKQNDVAIDQALDRLSAGVQVLHNNALQIGEELKVQKVLLEETEEKVVTVHDNLKNLNKKLRKTIKAVEKDRMCIYVVCFILLLGIAGGIYWQISSR